MPSDQFSPSDHKKEIRREVFARRERHPATDREEKSLQIARQVFGLEEYRQAKRIFIYIDCRGEVMTETIIRQAWADGKEVAVPKILPDPLTGKKEMMFFLLTDFGQLEPGFYGIREPRGCERADGNTGGLMLMPGVAFDPDGHRVGYGGGYYDRYTALYPGLYRAALAFSFQLFAAVPWEKGDVPVQAVVTEEKVYRI